MAFRSTLAVLAVLSLPSQAGAAVPDTKITKFRSGPLIGLADNQPQTLADRRFQKSGIKRMRVLVPYDAMANGGFRRAYLDAWFTAAKFQGIEPLVSFYRSDRGKRRIPSVTSFRRHFRLFRLRYPWVKLFSTWNEANFADAQPTGRYPKRTAQFYRTLRKECAVGRCTVLAADFRSDGSKASAKWLKTFKRHMGGGPHRWGLVSHPDITRRSTRQTRWFLKNTRGPVWATEAGAVNFFGRGVKPSISRQTQSMRFLMGKYPRVSRRLQRMYIYHWRAARGNRLWDSGLQSVSGKRRPAYYVFFRAIGKRAP